MPRLTPEVVSLQKLLADHTTAAAPALAHALDDQTVQCVACGHRCRVLPGRDGVCRVRFNRDGELLVPFNYVAGLAVDPIEKKPFYHAFPGHDTLSFGMLGCNLHCAYCQNWITSQTLRDAHAIAKPHFLRPEQVVQRALDHHCPVLTSTYNEPLITAEWAAAIFQQGQSHGLRGACVSNGHGTPEVLEFLRPSMDLLKIDLKAFQDATYRKLGGTRTNVLDTIRRGKEMDYWIEVVTLVVPELNDSDDELKQIADFIAGVAPEIPWHVTAFHPQYKMDGPGRTPTETLLRACDHGKAAGLQFVYPGNVAGGVGQRQNTFCPTCDRLLIERRGFGAVANHINHGACPDCRTPIPGVWA